MNSVNNNNCLSESGNHGGVIFKNGVVATDKICIEAANLKFYIIKSLLKLKIIKKGFNNLNPLIICFN